VEDKNRNMRMLKITTMDDLVKNSMNILEPSPVDASGNDREDGKIYFHVTGKAFPPSCYTYKLLHQWGG
jgi:hypothetical protein